MEHLSRLYSERGYNGLLSDVTVIVAPSCSGKTYLIKQNLLKGGVRRASYAGRILYDGDEIVSRHLGWPSDWEFEPREVRQQMNIAVLSAMLTFMRTVPEKGVLLTGMPVYFWPRVLVLGVVPSESTILSNATKRVSSFKADTKWTKEAYVQSRLDNLDSMRGFFLSNGVSTFGSVREAVASLTN